MADLFWRRIEGTERVNMPPTQQESGPLTLNRIRVETALSRFPIHRLARKGNVNIDIQRISASGEADFRWEVSYTAKYGQPGPLAYKVDTLIVNRRVDEARRPLPELIKLGSLTDICTEMGMGRQRGEPRSYPQSSASKCLRRDYRQDPVQNPHR